MAHARCFPWVKENTHIKVNKEVLEASIHRWRNTCKSSAVNAKQSYQRALHLTPWEASIYTDIAISLDLVQSFEGKSVLDPNSWYEIVFVIFSSCHELVIHLFNEYITYQEST